MRPHVILDQHVVDEIDEMPVELWEKVLGLNLTGAMVCAKCVIGGMKKNGWGRIINIASDAALLGDAMRSSYAAAKAGMFSGFSFSPAAILWPPNPSRCCLQSLNAS